MLKRSYFSFFFEESCSSPTRETLSQMWHMAMISPSLLLRGPCGRPGTSLDQGLCVCHCRNHWCTFIFVHSTMYRSAIWHAMCNCFFPEGVSKHACTIYMDTVCLKSVWLVASEKSITIVNERKKKYLYSTFTKSSCPFHSEMGIFLHSLRSAIPAVPNRVLQPMTILQRQNVLC